MRNLGQAFPEYEMKRVRRSVAVSADPCVSTLLGHEVRRLVRPTSTVTVFALYALEFRLFSFERVTAGLVKSDAVAPDAFRVSFLSVFEQGFESVRMCS